MTDAKKYFSKRNAPAQQRASDYLSGAANRQEYLETAIKWISKDKIIDYMGRHQHKPNANYLWRHFSAVIDWVEVTFPKKRKEMKQVDWGPLYDEFKNDDLDPDQLEAEIQELILDNDVTSTSGVYPFVLTREERHLNIRKFTKGDIQTAYEKQKGICAICGEHFELEDMEADHITPWHKGGKTTIENLQMLCQSDNRQKGGV